MPPPIEKLADKFLSNPKRIEVSPRGLDQCNITSSRSGLVAQKRETLRYLLENDRETAIIFANRKTTVRELNKSLKRHGFRAARSTATWTSSRIKPNLIASRRRGQYSVRLRRRRARARHQGREPRVQFRHAVAPR
jgi:superfamily II DNA/RNA helicase